MTAPTSPGGPTVLVDGDLQVTVDGGAGPRLTSVRVRDIELLATLAPPVIAGPDGGPQLALHGGHRLWAAPETTEVTYRLDDRPCPVTVEGTTRATVADAGTPLGRRLEVTVHGDGVSLRHVLVNRGDRPLHVAPWAITQLRPGGMIVMPVGDGPLDRHGMQPAGLLATWPYTDLSDERIAVHPGLVSIEGRARDDVEGPDPTKVGVDGFAGWAAHVHGDVLLTVLAPPRTPTATFADLGAATQSYVHRRFTEVESLGPLTNLGPGEEAVLDQRWVLSTAPDDPWDAVAVAASAKALSAAHR